MQATAPLLTTDRAAMLHSIARAYVTHGLGGKNFDAIPYAENVSLRAPLCPGGSGVPLVGREKLRAVWWPPLPQLVGRVEVLDTFVNADLTAVTVEFHCEILNPACTLRIVDRFRIDEEGRIVEQENFFDPRDVTNPGWNASASGQTEREGIIQVVESYVGGLGKRDFSSVPFAPDFTYESPLLVATIGQPRLVGQAAIDYLSGLFPAIRGTRVVQHIVEGEFCATFFHFDTVFGTIPVFDRFHVVDGQLKLANPFYDPTPIVRGTAEQQPA